MIFCIEHAIDVCQPVDADYKIITLSLQCNSVYYLQVMPNFHKQLNPEHTSLKSE